MHVSKKDYENFNRTGKKKKKTCIPSWKHCLFLVFIHVMRRPCWCTKQWQRLKVCIIIESNSQKTFALVLYTNMAAVISHKTENKKKTALIWMYIESSCIAHCMWRTFEMKYAGKARVNLCLSNNGQNQLFWACKKHPQQTIVLTKSAGQQPGSDHCYLRPSIVFTHQKLKPGYLDHHLLGQATLRAKALDLRSEDYESKTHKLLVDYHCCYPSLQWFIDTFTNWGLTAKWSHQDGRRKFLSFKN